MRLLLAIIATLFLSLTAFSKVPDDQFSSVSTVRRELALEKDKAYKERIKQLKKQYDQDDIKDVAIETWTDGVTYYVFYTGNKKDGLQFSLQPIDAPRALFTYNADGNVTSKSMNMYDEIAIIEREGYKFFKTSDSNNTPHRFHNGLMDRFNLDENLVRFGGKPYIRIDYDYSKSSDIFSLDGQLVASGNKIEFFPAEKAGISVDEASGLALWHPDMGDRFVATTDTEYLAKVKWPCTHTVNKTVSKEEFEITVPGGCYLIQNDFPKHAYTATEARTDPFGNTRMYKVFVEEDRHINHSMLYLNQGDTVKPLLGYKSTKIKISSPDQLVYYTYRDSVYTMPRMGCRSLVDESLNIPPKFSDVMVLYSDDHKPTVYVKFTYFSPWEVYDPAKSYDLSTIEHRDREFERGFYYEMIDHYRTDKPETLSASDFNRWATSEVKDMLDKRDRMNEDLELIRTGKIPDYDEDLYGRIYKLENYPLPSVDDAIKAARYFADQRQGEEKEKYLLLASYMTTLRDQHNELEKHVVKTYSKYKADKEYAIKAAEAAAFRAQLEAEENRRQNQQYQQAVMLNFIHVLASGLNLPVATYLPAPVSYTPQAARTPNVQQPTPGAQTQQHTQPAPRPYIIGERMIDKTTIAPEITGMAMCNGWVPEYTTTSSSEPATKSNSSSSHGNICHACFSSGKCSVCNGKGRYMPNLDGKYIDCTACGKTGRCKQCNGTGHH